MGLKLGSKDVIKNCLGSKRVFNMYSGNNLIFTKRKILPSKYKQLSYVGGYFDQGFGRYPYFKTNMQLLSDYDTFSFHIKFKRAISNHLGGAVIWQSGFLIWVKDINTIGINVNGVSASLSMSVEVGLEISIDIAYVNNKLYIKASNGETKISEIYDATTKTVNTNVAYLLHNGGSGYSSYDYLELTQFKNGVLVYDLVPALRVTDSYGGFYDTVNKIYTVNGRSNMNNIRKGTVIEYPDSIHNYQRVEYIESDGNQYIDTGVISSNSRLQIKFEFTSLGNAQHVSAWWKSSGNQIYHPYMGDGNNIFNYAYASGGIPTGVTATVNTEYTIDSTLKNGYQKVIINDKEFTSSNTGTLSPISFYLFGSHDSSTSGVYKPSKIKLDYAKYYDNDVLVRDFVPCYGKTDGEIGLYDLVNDKFYFNLGSGTFIKGNDV